MGCGAPCGSKTPITQKRLDLVLRDVEEQLQEVQSRLVGSEQESAASRAASEAEAQHTSVRLSRVTSNLEERWEEDARQLHERCESNEHFSRNELRSSSERCASLEKSQLELSVELAEAEASMHDTEQKFAAHRAEAQASMQDTEQKFAEHRAGACTSLLVSEGQTQALSEQLDLSCREAELTSFKQENRISSLHRERDASIAQSHEIREELWAERVKRETADKEILLLRRRLEELADSKDAAEKQHLRAEGHASAFEQVLRNQCNELRQERNEVMELRDAALCERDTAMKHFRTATFEHGKELALEQGQAAGLQSSLKETRLQLRREREQILRLHDAAATSAKSNAARAASVYLNVFADQTSFRQSADALRYGRSVDVGSPLLLHNEDPKDERVGTPVPILEPSSEPVVQLLPPKSLEALPARLAQDGADEPPKTANFLCSLHETKLQLQKEQSAIERLHSSLAMPLK